MGERVRVLGNDVVCLFHYNGLSLHDLSPEARYAPPQCIVRPPSITKVWPVT